MDSQRRSRWERCIYGRGQEAESFVQEHFGEQQRRAVLIAGAGFDPRSTILPALLAKTMGDRAQGILIREERPSPKHELISRAESNIKTMMELLPASQTTPIEVFALDGAVIGGREATKVVSAVDLTNITDIAVDFSALSKGIVFPIVRHLLMNALKVNIHLFVVDDPSTDDQIVAVGSDRAGLVHGFRGGWGLDSYQQAAKLWLPQLITRQKAILERIHLFVEPHDVSPILPFPASTPRLPDGLIEEYEQEFESIWRVDTRDIVYADEKNPLDLYRTILRLDDARKTVFQSTGGSMIVLSPIGSKALAIGALMAAVERDFPVVHVEAVSYDVDLKELQPVIEKPKELVHIWLSGEAYAEKVAV